jgi:arylsulfatase A-like enzyme
MTLPFAGKSRIAAGVMVLATVAVACQEAEQQVVERPNVLFIAVDDLNDWIEPLGGHPQARTPNLNRLADQGITFTRAYTASPGCNPSRTALLTGRHTYSTGMYSNYQYWREVLPSAVTLPAYFSEHGYWSAGAGKIFHNDQPDPASWDAYFPSKEEHMPDYFYPSRGSTVNMPKFEGMYGDFDWSPIDLPDEETGDYRSVDWVIQQLQQRSHEQPFFLAAGIYRPHLPWYVPREYFDLFPLESVQLPSVLENDLADIGERGRDIASRAGNYHRHVVEAGQWQAAVQGYLAAIAYADALVGRLLDALDASPHADNTIVVLWSDHGWQLGEKEHWRKFALWENVARVVLMMKVPEGVAALPSGTPAGARSDRVTSLVDLFPTLVELAGLPEKEGLDGRSLVPLLQDPNAEWEYPAITTYDYSEYSVRTERWRYIRYIDGTEELYDHDIDPEEWNNLAGLPKYSNIKDEMAGYIPVDPAPLVETAYKLSPHHVPPFRSREHYLEWKRRHIP